MVNKNKIAKTTSEPADHVGEKFDPGVERFTYVGSPEASRGTAQRLSDDEMWQFFSSIK